MDLPRARPDRGGPSRPGAVEGIYGIHPVREALRARRRVLHRLRLRKGVDSSAVSELINLATAAAIPVEEVDADLLAASRGGSEGAAEVSTQGVVLEAGPLPVGSLDELAAGGESPRTLVALDGVEDPQNLGAIARVSEAAGVSGLILTHRRSAPVSPAAVRASAGALEWLAVARVPNLGQALKHLKTNGFWVFGAVLESADALYSLSDRVVAGDRILVLGAEGAGLRPGIESHLDHRVQIPMAGQIESLNVATAAAVILFEFRRRRGVANPS